MSALPYAALAAGSALTTLGTGITEYEYARRSAFKEAIAVSLVGSALTALSTAILLKVVKSQETRTTAEKIEAIVVSTVATFITSEGFRRLGVPLFVQATAVGIVAATVWAYYFNRYSS